MSFGVGAQEWYICVLACCVTLIKTHLKKTPLPFPRHLSVAVITRLEWLWGISILQWPFLGNNRQVCVHSVMLPLTATSPVPLQLGEWISLRSKGKETGEVSSAICWIDQMPCKIVHLLQSLLSCPCQVRRSMSLPSDKESFICVWFYLCVDVLVHMPVCTFVYACGGHRGWHTKSF